MIEKCIYMQIKLKAKQLLPTQEKDRNINLWNLQFLIYFLDDFSLPYVYYVSFFNSNILEFNFNFFYLQWLILLLLHYIVTISIGPSSQRN